MLLPFRLQARLQVTAGTDRFSLPVYFYKEFKMYKRPAATITASILCLLLTSSVSMANEIMVIDEDLEVLPQGYQLSFQASANATAAIQIGNLGISNGLIFDGSWNVPASGFEFAVGALGPILLTPADFQIDPREIGGVLTVRFTLDAEVISSTMVPPEQGIFAQLFVLQLQENDTVLSFGDTGSFVEAGQSVAIDVSWGETDFGAPGSRPDFSPMGRPIAFALQLGAAYPRTTNPNAFFVDGRMTADNWTVAVTSATGVFRNGFEPVPGMSLSAEAPDDANCPCPVLPPSIID